MPFHPRYNTLDDCVVWSGQVQSAKLLRIFNMSDAKSPDSKYLHFHSWQFTADLQGSSDYAAISYDATHRLIICKQQLTITAIIAHQHLKLKQ
jgi:hypothetical protein